MSQSLSKILSLFLSFCLIFEHIAFAQSIDLSHYFANSGKPIFQGDKFRPLHLRYLGYDNLSQDFKILLDKGDTKKEDLENKTYIEENTQTLLKYFFIGLVLPNEKFWVNLRPDSPDNILDSDLEKTDIGRIFLEADLQLKKDTASFTSPQNSKGKAYWDKLYKKARELFGNENITIPTLTRPWIVPKEIIIREAPDNAYIYKATLKVMLEEDYLSSRQSAVSGLGSKGGGYTQYEFKDSRLKELNQYSTQLIKETIIPKLTYEINTSKRYAPLRQVYYSLILAQWFKQKYGSPGSIRATGISAPVNSYIDLIDSGNLTNLISIQPYDKQAYFKQYQKSFAEGEYNLREPVYSPQGQSVRRYMSGGMRMDCFHVIERISGTGSPILNYVKTMKSYVVYLLVALPLTIFYAGLSIEAKSIPSGKTPPASVVNLKVSEETGYVRLLRQALESNSKTTIEDTLWFALDKDSDLSRKDYIKLIPFLEEKISDFRIRDIVDSKNKVVSYMKDLLIKSYKEKCRGDISKVKGELTRYLSGLIDRIKEDTKGNANEEVIILWDIIFDILRISKYEKIPIDQSDLVNYKGALNNMQSYFRKYLFDPRNPAVDKEFWLRKYFDEYTGDHEYRGCIIEMNAPDPELLKEIALSELSFKIKSILIYNRIMYERMVISLLEDTVRNENDVKRVLRSLAWLTYSYEFKAFRKFIEEVMPQKNGDLKRALQIILYILSDGHFPNILGNDPLSKGNDSERLANILVEIMVIFCDVDTDIARVHIVAHLLLKDVFGALGLDKEFITEQNLVSLLDLLQREGQFDGGSIVLDSAYEEIYNFFSKSNINFQIDFIAKTAALDMYSNRDGILNQKGITLSERGEVLSSLMDIYKNYREYWDSLTKKLIYRIDDAYGGSFSFANLLRVFIHHDFRVSLSKFPYIDAWSLAMACAENMEIFNIEYTPNNIAEVIRLTQESLSKKRVYPFFKDTQEVIIVYDKNEQRFEEEAKRFKDSAVEAKVALITFIPADDYAREKDIANIVRNAKGKVFFAFFGHGNLSGYGAGINSDALHSAMKDYFKNNGVNSNFFLYSDCCYSWNINRELFDNLPDDGSVNITAFSVSGKYKPGISFQFPVTPDVTLEELIEYQKKPGYNEPTIFVLDNRNGIEEHFLKLRHPKSNKGSPRKPITISGSGVASDKVYMARKESSGGEKNTQTISSALESKNTFVSSSVESGKVPSLVLDKKGGIAFNALPIQTEAVASSVFGTLSGMRAFNGDLDAEWARIQAVFNAGIRPSVQRISEYAAAAATSLLAEEKIDQVRLMLADILRREEEEERLPATEPAVKNLIAVLES